MHSMKHFTIIGIVALVVITLCLPQASFADRLILPATTCQVWGGHAPEFSDHIQYSKFGRVYNTSTTNRVAVVCPVPRHKQNSSANWIRVYYWDQNPIGGTTGQLGCRLRSNSAYGETSVDSIATSTSASGGTDSGFWQFSGVVATGGNADFPRNYTLQCFLPPSVNGNESSIGSIVIDE